MAGTPEVLHRAVAAARAGDAEALWRLIDWPLTGAADMLATLPEVPPQDRAPNIALGLADMDRVGTDWTLVSEALAAQAEWLAPAQDIEPASPAELRAMLAALLVPAVPVGLTVDQLVRIDALRRRSELVTEVYVVIGPAGRRPFAIAPDTGLLVALLA